MTLVFEGGLGGVLGDVLRGLRKGNVLVGSGRCGWVVYGMFDGDHRYMLLDWF